MNATLLLLNALALVALFSFHTSSDNPDPALVHIDTANWVQRPTAQHAVIAPQRIRASLVQPEHGTAEPVDALPTVPAQATTERYVF